MKLSPEELASQGYQIKDTIDHDDLIPFVQTSFQKSGNWIRFFWGIHYIFLAFTLSWWIASGFGFWTGLGRLALGLLLSLTLIPLHEGIHGVALKAIGAPKVTYKANWRQFYFMAIADHFVTNTREFLFVALAPLTLITIIGLGLAAWWWPTDWALVPIALAWTHWLFCSGDLALVQFMWNHRDLNMVTYDDMQQKESYFLTRPNGSPPN
jgi:hypothetical protein